jgi:hypothetical protein
VRATITVCHVTSNLDCVGLGVDSRAGLERLVDAALEDADLLGTVAGVKVLRWQDPSGARMVFGVRGKDVLTMLPSYAGMTGARLANVRAVNDDVAVADVLDEDGEQATMLALELEERHLLPAALGPVGGPASVIALGVDAAMFADEAAFTASDASLVNERGDDDSEPPAHYAEQGWSWPPRMATESFISYGVFGTPKKAEAYARLNGVVLHAQRRTVVATGQQFVVARIRSAGFEADVCLAASDCPDIPVAGNIVGGTVFMVGSLPFPLASTADTEKRSWLPWRRR